MAQHFLFSFNSSQVTLTFDGKPSAEVRATLKRCSFRWSPGGGYWYRNKVAGAADFVAALEKQMDREAGIAADDFDLANNRSM
jgi:hypothetical protein